MATSGMLPPPPSDSEPWSEKDFAADRGVPAPPDRHHASNRTAWACSRQGCDRGFRSRDSPASPSSTSRFSETTRPGWGCPAADRPEHGQPHVVLPRAGALHVHGRAGCGAALKEIARHDGPDLVGGLLVGPGAVQHGDGPGRDDPGDLTVSKVEIWASDLSLEMLKVAARAIYSTPRRAGGLAAAAPPVLPARPRAARRLIPGRSRDPRPGRSSAIWTCGTPPGRCPTTSTSSSAGTCRSTSPKTSGMTLLDRLRPAPSARRLAGDGQRRDPARRSRHRSASTPRRSTGRRRERPWPTRDRHSPACRSTPIEVMVVDDSAVVRQRLKSIIESDPRFRVVLAADPYEAVALLSKSRAGRDRCSTSRCPGWTD